MKTKIAYSVKNNAESVVKDLKKKLGQVNEKLLVYFASANYEPVQLADLMGRTFEGTRTIGCTTAGELISGMMLKDSVVAMCFDESMIDDFEVASVKNLSQNIDLNAAVLKFESHFNKKFYELEHDKYFGIVLFDGLCGKEELFMDELGNLSNVIFVGGSAGDDLKFKSTYLFDGNSAFSDGAILILIKPKNKFGFIKTQSFKVLEKTLTPTKVDEENREVLEFNNEPAAVYYSKMLNEPEEKISDYFMKHPVGLVINGDPFVRSPQLVKENAIKFYCNIKEGVELNLLESTDIIKDTRLALKKYENENGEISAIINFNCILRTLELENKGLCEEYSKLFSDYPTIGFSTYGEEYIGHINQTATMLVL